jgi:hypothetical protein
MREWGEGEKGGEWGSRVRIKWEGERWLRESGNKGRQ